jgi:predicted transglutaminase-like cysteine proteinase
MLGLALSSAACASVPEGSAQMALGAQAVAPRGFVQFCERQPTDCGASPSELREMEIASAQGQAQPVAAIAYDWSKVFPQAHPAQAAALNAVATAPAAPYDWAAVFAQAKAQPAVVKASWTPAPARKAAQPLVLKTVWPLLTSTNDRINRAISERTDQEIYGVSEYWALPLESGLTAGDCEDYALEKRHALIAAGVPSEALSIAVVTTVRGDTHAVLLVATDHGEYVLDNLSAWVVPWTQAGYTWRERQVAGSPSRWQYAAGGEPLAQPQQPLPGSRLLLASAR